jgi:DNA-binding transcriptional LysR family regulator
MNTKDLRSFCATIDCGGLSEAARRHRTTQPTISRQIQRLERELGAELLRRDHRGIHLTEPGQKLLEFARHTLAEYDALQHACHTPATSLAGTVKIVASTTPGEYLVPQLAARFTTHHPQVNIDETITDSAGVASRVLSRRWHIGFTGADPDTDRLVAEPVGQDEIVLAVAPSHPLASRSALTTEVLAGQRLILRGHGSGTLRIFEQELADRGFALPLDRFPVLTLGSTHAVLAAVEADHGIGVVSARALDHHRPHARALRIAGAPIMRSLYLVHEPTRQLPPHVKAFINATIDSGRGRT